MRIETYLKKNSENIAGVISLLSSTSLAFTGDSKSLAAAGIFTAAELTLARFGHKVEGYAAGATLFAVGDLTLAFSSAVQNETTLQTTLLVMAAAWGAGALRYPFEQAAKANGFSEAAKNCRHPARHLRDDESSYAHPGNLFSHRSGKIYYCGRDHGLGCCGCSGGTIAGQGSLGLPRNLQATDFRPLGFESSVLPLILKSSSSPLTLTLILEPGVASPFRIIPARRF
jgi:hypothetical protein